MRRAAAMAVVFVLAMSIGLRDSSAGPRDCLETHCGMYCMVFGSFPGYCSGPTDPTTGCIQLYGPDCASMHNAYCCRPQSAGAF
jgi:hypothetical protein